jgi:hypothetical protein
MPTFSFSLMGNLLFKGTLKCQQCDGTTKTGKQCSRKTCMYLPFCYQHMRTELGIYVAPSGIAGAGLGLYAAKDFKKGAKITVLDGEPIDDAEAQRRYGDATRPYLLEEKPGIMVDGALERHVGQYANSRFSASTKRSVQKGTNSDFLLYKPPGKPRKVYITATKKIKKDTEILAWYGREYILDDGKAVTR